MISPEIWIQKADKKVAFEQGRILVNEFKHLLGGPSVYLG